MHVGGGCGGGQHSRFGGYPPAPPWGCVRWDWVMEIEQEASAVAPAASVTLIANEYVPAVVGMPLINPVEAFRLRPVGKLPEFREYVYGAVPLDADRECVYATLTDPDGGLLQAIESGATGRTAMVTID